MAMRPTAEPPTRTVATVASQMQEFVTFSVPEYLPSVAGLPGVETGTQLVLAGQGDAVMG